MWQCCKRHYADGIKTCKVCNQPKKTVTTDGERIIVKREETPQKAKEREAKNKNAKLVRKIKPGTEDQLWTSTLPGGPRP
jgi:RNA polymerase subunit RPABC4/transcription elongation factor Spt4